MKSRNPQIEFDELQMYFGYPYTVNCENVKGLIKVNVPKIGKIVKLGEKRFYQTLNIFTTNTTSHRAMLWDMGINWNELSDFELFCMLYRQIDYEASNLIFEGIDFQKFQLTSKILDGNQSVVLYDEENNLEINEDVYFHISQFLREVFNTYPEEKITNDKVLQRQYITKDKRQAEIDAIKEEKGEKQSSSIRSIISACVNHPGFKYKLEELEDMNVCQFYDSVKRLQIYESTTALMKGMYSGFVSSKDLHADDYNFMKDIKKN